MKVRHMDNGTPLLDKIREYLEKEIIGFHTPGHERGNGCSEELQSLAQRYPLGMDLTEVPGLDNLRAPQGCLEESQMLAAKAFGACETFFLVNGSTLGIQAAVMAVNKPGRKIIIARNSHIATFNAIVLSGGVPVFAPAEMEKEWGFPLGVSADNFKNTWKSNPDAESIVLTHPEYRGIGVNIKKTIEFIKSWQIPIVIDEAHGSHLYFQESLPLSAQSCAPDITIHSSHKTLAALTQASMIHINDKVWSNPIRTALNILQTTSPSYLLLASLDSVQAQMNLQGQQIVAKVMEIAQSFAYDISRIGGYRIFKANNEDGWYQDPTKVLVSAADLGLTGWELATELQYKYNICVEMSDYYYALFLIHCGHTNFDIERVTDALRSIRKLHKKKTLPPLYFPKAVFNQTVQPELSPREVFFAEKEAIPIKAAQHRVIAEPYVFYPPGIPFLWPGEVILNEHIEFIEELCQQRNIVPGISSNGMVSVLRKG